MIINLNIVDKCEPPNLNVVASTMKDQTYNLRDEGKKFKIEDFIQTPDNKCPLTYQTVVDPSGVISVSDD